MVAVGEVAASTNCRADIIDVGLIHLHGESSGLNGSESSLTWWEEKGRLSGRQDSDGDEEVPHVQGGEKPRRK